ncbi:MAG: polynucleotide adenylyltransferase [Oleiphilaceae bacterium]|nr:polynucleotide adenylyltransferase [Oleiphilaceae bacterium]
MEYYLVGGAVRDELLGLPVKDRDWVVVGATPGAMTEAGFKPVGADFPVFLHPQTHEEYALARTERKQGHGYHGFTVHSAPDVTLEEDLQRRDLTINAMARKPDGDLVDPYGGQRDLSLGHLRHVSPAFSEDPLRILRTARFAARFAPLGFTVAHDTMALMGDMVASGEADHLVPERVWQETRRALHEASPGVYFRVLRDCGALQRVMPELDRTLSLDDRPLDCLSRAAELSDDTAVLYSALTVGQAPESLDSLGQRFKLPNDCRTLAQLRLKLMSWAHAVTDSPAPRQLWEAISLADGWRRPERFAQLLLACRATGMSGKLAGTLEKAREQSAAVDPQALMARGFKGKALGRAIEEERLERIARL